MKRVSIWLFLVAGCSARPCATSSECGSGEVCAAAHCQALSCDSVFYATDPSDGNCRPLPACGNRDDVAAWVSCVDPCAHEDENTCIADGRCQPIYSGDSGPTPPCAASPFFDGGSAPGCGGARHFAGCRGNPLRVDPCAGLDATACARDPRCTGLSLGVACDCPPGAACSCPDGGFECQLKSCGDFDESECEKHSECTRDPGAQPFPTATSGPDGGVPLDAPFFGCFPKGFGSCLGMDEAACLQHAECHPVGDRCYCPPGATCVCGGGHFLFCEPDDGLHRCSGDAECGANQRCNNDERCTPAPGNPTSGSCPGVCVPKGCAGYGELRCNTDPSCEPSYALNCSPYGGGGEDFGACAPPSTTPPSTTPAPGAPQATPVMCGGDCEPSFVACNDAPRGSVVDPDKSVMMRQPGVVDSRAFAFDVVMGKLAGAQDPARFVDAWLSQLGADLTVGDKHAAARPKAADYFAAVPRLADGRLDLAALGFQVTSLSNRIDLAGPNDCGEARITYALAGGVTDRRHRMTAIVELRQPDDGARCAKVASQWVALSKLDGDALRAAAEAIFAPLVAPAHLAQVRTNEFLVGQPASFDAPDAWELREWRLGGDGALHLAPSKQALDPALTADPKVGAWLKSNRAALLAQRIAIPDAYLALTSSENGQRLGWIDPDTQLPDEELQTTLNRLACAGCHTTEFNTAFAHVAERFRATDRAQISEFLRGELPHRGQRLFEISLGRLDAATRGAAKPVH